MRSIAGSAGAGATLSRQAARNLVFLAANSTASSSPKEPNLYAFDAEPRFVRDFIQARGEVFFKSLDRALSLSMVTWSGRQFAVAHGAQLSAERLLGYGDAKFLENPLRQIDQPPAHHAVNRRDRATLNHLRDNSALGIIELRGLAWRFAVKQPVRTACIEPQHPVPNDLKPDAADLCRLSARGAVIDRRNSQQPPSLRRGSSSSSPAPATKPRSRKSPPQWYRHRHGEPPSFAMFESNTKLIYGRSSNESEFQRPGIRSHCLSLYTL